MERDSTERRGERAVACGAAIAGSRSGDRQCRGVALAVLGAGAVLSSPSPANAEDAPQVRLVWVRGERTDGCDDGPSIARRVVERLGREVFGDSAPRSIEGVLQHEGDRWDAHLYVRDSNGSLLGSRYLTSTAPDCAPLDSAVILAVALAIDPESAARPRPPSSAPVEPPAPSPPPPAPVSPVAAQPLPSLPPSPTPSRSRPPPLKRPEGPPEGPRSGGLSASMRVLAAAGVLPELAAGAALSVEGPSGRTFQGTGGVLYFPEVRTSAPADFAFGVTAGWLGGCGQPWRAERVALFLCAKLFIGAIHSVVYTLNPTQPGDRLWSGASVSSTAKFRIAGPFLAEIGAEVLVPLTRQPFMVRGESKPIFEEGSVDPVGFAGVGVSIP